MLKIFTTQLTGYFQHISEKNDLVFEEAGRMLAGTLLGDGNVFIHGLHELSALADITINGPDSLPKARPLVKENTLQDVTGLDQVILFTPLSSDPEAIQLAEKLKAQGVSVIGISAVEKAESSLEQYVDFHINTRMKGPIVPLDDGSKIGYPSTMTAMYAYYGLYLTTKEILVEHEEM